MEYEFIPKETIAHFKINKDHTLTPEEVATLIVEKSLWSKLLKQRCFAIQLEIGSGLHRGEDEVYHKVIEELMKIENFIGNELEQKYNVYQTKLNEQNKE